MQTEEEIDLSTLMSTNRESRNLKLGGGANHLLKAKLDMERAHDVFPVVVQHSEVNKLAISKEDLDL